MDLTAKRQAYLDSRAHLDRRSDRVFGLAMAAATGDLGLQPDWRSSVQDALNTLIRIAKSDNHPDDVDRAYQTISHLAGMFHTVDDIEAAYLGGEEP